MKLLITFFFLFSSISTLAQINTEASIEFPLKYFRQNRFVIPLPQKELIVFIDNEEDMPPAQPQTAIIKLDSSLNQVWKRTLPIYFRLMTGFHGISGNNIFFYVSRTDSLYQILSIDLANGAVKRIDCENILGKTFEAAYFATLPNTFLFAEKKEIATLSYITTYQANK